MIERPFPATEKVLASLIETGKYSQISRESYLIVKENYVSRKMNSFVSIFLLISKDILLIFFHRMSSTIFNN